MFDSVDAIMLKKMFLAGTKNLESKQDYINELNVFPVPDGDTGTNMTLTLVSAAKDLAELPDDAGIEEVGKRISAGTLKGARGNSGVIMSQLCRGFVKEVEGAGRIDKVMFANAFDRAQQTAYKAVMKPKEGTILTVARVAAEKAVELSKQKEIFLDRFFKEIIKEAEDTLEKTPDMLPVLKEAGVVDSGGQGLLEFFRGAYEAFSGKDTDFDFDAAATSYERTSVIDTTNIETADIRFAYCTEFIINAENDFREEDEAELKEYLSGIGDSLVCVSMDNIVKIHVHTNDPGLAIQKGLSYGYLSSMKIDNMREEHHEKVIKEVEKHLSSQSSAAEPPAAKKEDVINKEYEFVSVCAGEGLKEVFKNMSVEHIIEGGQTMNPSTEDILGVLDGVHADNIYLLPNNSNIILTSIQAQKLCKDKNVIVIPTKNITQGITAVINYVPAMSIEDNAKRMEKAIKEIKTAEVTYAVRDTRIDGKHIEKDDYMAIGDDGLLAVGKEPKDVALEAVRNMFDDDSEIITVYYGEDAKEDEVESLQNEIEAEFEDAEVDVVYGGQPVYTYIISVE